MENAGVGAKHLTRVMGKREGVKRKVHPGGGGTKGIGPGDVNRLLTQ